MGNHEPIDTVLSKIEGTNIKKDKLKELFLDYQKKYEPTVKKYLVNPNFNEILSQIKEIIKNNESFVKKFHENIKNKVIQSNEHGLSWPNPLLKAIPEILGLIFALYTLNNSEDYLEIKENSYLWQPQTAQILAIFRVLCLDDDKDLLCNNLAEIGTGEGKSIALASCSIIFALFGFEVNCVCYSEYLSKRDYNDFYNFFQELGVAEYIYYGTFNKMCEKKINDEFNDLRTAIKDLILNRKLGVFNKGNARTKILLIDEVDVFFSKEFYGKLYTPEASLCDPLITAFIEMVWKAKNVALSYKAISNSPQYKECKKLFNDWAELFEEAVKFMIQDLKSFENHGYSVQNNKIVYRDHDRFADNISDGYKTIFAYLHEIERGKIQKNSDLNEIMKQFWSINVSCGDFSFAELPTKSNFAFIIGVTGTLRTLEEYQAKIIETKYNIKKQSIIPSVYGKKENKLTFIQRDDIKIRETMNEYHMEIQTEITEKLNNGNRAVIVVFSNEAKLKDFFDSQYCQNFKEKFDILTEECKENEISKIVKTAATQGKVTLITKTFGRGTDFICQDEKLSQNGGVHILQTFFSTDLSEEIQIKGRTARQGQKGSYSMILLENELEYFLVFKKDIQEYQGKYYDLLNNKRNCKSKEDSKYLEEEVKKASKKHKASLELLESLKSGDQTTILKHLLEFNKSGYVEAKNEYLSRTMIMIDGTHSMDTLLQQTKMTLSDTFEETFRVLKEAKIEENCFSIQIVIYRNYDCDENEILKASSWENSANNLIRFLRPVNATNGWGNEAIEVAFWHANQEIITKKKKLSQIILIGDAPPNTEIEVEGKRKQSRIDWSKTKFKDPTHYKKEMKSLIDNKVIFNTFYLIDRSRASFQEIANDGKGECLFLDVNSANGAELLKDSLTKFILKDIAQNAGLGNQLVQIHEQHIKQRKGHK